MAESPKWEAYRRLCERLPSTHICQTRLCKSDVDVVREWGSVAQDGIACVRTDTPAGGVGLPFLAFVPLWRAAEFCRRHGSRYLYLINEPIRCDINGKAVQIDDDTLVVEWGRCQTARDFDVGKVAATSIAIGPNNWAVWGESVLRCYKPEHCTHMQLDVLYKELFRSGLKETCWSLTQEGRLIFWG